MYLSIHNPQFSPAEIQKQKRKSYVILKKKQKPITDNTVFCDTGQGSHEISEVMFYTISLKVILYIWDVIKSDTPLSLHF